MAAPATSRRSAPSIAHWARYSAERRRRKDFGSRWIPGASYAAPFFRSDHFPFARAGVPSLSLESGDLYIGRGEGWGQAQRKEYNEKRYHQAEDEMLDWFSMDGTVQQIWVIMRTAWAVADAPDQPSWNQGSEFRAAGENRLR